MSKQRAEGVPEGWQRVKLGDVVTKVGSGVTPKGGSKAYVAEGIPLIRSQNVLWGHLDLEDVARITPKQHEKMSGSALQRGDVLLNITGASIGRACVYDLDREANVNQHVCIVRASSDTVPDFLKAHLLSEKGQRQIDLFQAGGNRQGLNFEQVKAFPVLLPPPLPEQRKIAAILGTWDGGLATLAALVAAKREQKRGLAQLLLTGERRMAGFEGEWQETTWGDVLSESRIPATDELGKRLTVALHLQGVSIREERDNSQVGKTNYFARKAGQFIYGKQNLFRGALGLVPPELDGYLSSQDLPAFDVAPHADPRFVYEYFARPHFYESLERISSGTGSKRVQPKKLYALTFQLPPLPEQRAIAAVLSTLDAEIAALEGLRERLQEQKRGLMDELLTGRTRVRV